MKNNYFVILVVFVSIFKIQITFGKKRNYCVPYNLNRTNPMTQSQVDVIISSLGKILTNVTEQQNHGTFTHVLNSLQTITKRFEKMEEEITTTESFDKMRLEQLLNSAIKKELLIDQVSRKIETNQEQINNRLSNIDSMLQKIHNNQDNLEKEILKINIGQRTLMTTADKLTEEVKDIKSNSSKIIRTPITENEFQQQIMNAIQNITQEKINQCGNSVTSFVYNKNNETKQRSFSQYQADNDVQKRIQEDLFQWITVIDSKCDAMKEKIESIETSVNELLDLGDKIYNKIDTEYRDGFNPYMNNVMESIQEGLETGKYLENELKENFELILNGQHNFFQNCDRLQLHESHIEDKVVEILQNLFHYIDNKTRSISTGLENLSSCKTEPIKFENNLMEEMRTYFMAIQDNFLNVQKNMTNFHDILLKLDANIQITKQIKPRVLLPIHLNRTILNDKNTTTIKTPILAEMENISIERSATSFNKSAIERDPFTDPYRDPEYDDDESF